ncbi:hypothetical protein WJX73_003269 [Symbiochloris irregularis]|uniref:ACT domain-containing protein n=1 Tax=Symbiochloris irregularis TaxID=706552 RepID=A0AAW1P3S6_9CHLO
MALAFAAADLHASSWTCRPQPAPHITLPRALDRSSARLPAAVMHLGTAGLRQALVRVTATANVAEDYVKEETVETPEGIPNPVVKIDNQSDKYHTVVSIEFGDRLGELLDTIAALKRLGLSIRKAKINPQTPSEAHTFLVTDSNTADKIIKSARLEEIRFTILSNLLKFHPEAGQMMGGKWGTRAHKPLPKVPTEKPLGARVLYAPSSTPSAVNTVLLRKAWVSCLGRLKVAKSLEQFGSRNRQKSGTTVIVRDSEQGGFSEMDIVTTDRPGLLTDIVKVLKDINVNVISAEVDTEGPLAKDQFLVSYHGDPLNSSMATLVQNALQYYLGLAEVESEESY